MSLRFISFATFIRLPVWVCFAVFQAAAGDYLVTSLDVDDGLPVSTITGAAQTSDGYLWFGTLMGGLSRCDGVRFVNYDKINTPELGNDSVRHLFVDNEGALWIDTYNALVRWQHGVFHSEMRHDPHLERFLFSDARQVVFLNSYHQLLLGEKRSDGTLHWINWTLLKPPGGGPLAQYCADKEGVIWYRHADGSLWRVREGRCEPVVDSGLSGKLTVLAVDRQQRIWAGTTQGLARWEGDRFQNATPTNGEPGLVVRRIFFCRDNSFWVEGNGRLRHGRGLIWEAEAGAGKLPLESKMGMVREDGVGGLWMSSTEPGLTHIGPDGSVDRLPGAEFPGRVIRFLHLDAELDLWVGFERGGLVKIRKRFFQTVGRSEGMEDTVVSSLCQGKDGTIWMGLVGGTLSRWQNGTCTNFTLPQNGSRSQFAMVNTDADGRIWVAALGNGLMVSADGSKFDHVVPPDQLKDTVRLLQPMRDGQVWLGTQTALYRYARGALKEMARAQTPSENITALAEAPDGALWIGTLGEGLMRYNGTNFQTFHVPRTMPMARLWSLCVETNGTVWVGCSTSGLFRFQDGQFTYFSATNGLPAQSISQVLDDGLGNLWLGTSAGIGRVSKADLQRCADGKQKTVSCRMFGHSEGLKTLGCALELHPLCARARDGRLWFAMNQGAASVLPENVTPSRFTPPVLIEAVNLDGKNILPATGTARVAKPSVLKIPPGAHDLEFRFTAISLSSPEGVRLRYQLEGLETSWQPAGNNRSVVYRYLPPGSYQFRVSACNSGGVWNECSSPVSLLIAPHFWQEMWFPWAVATVLSILVGFIWRQQQRRRLQLEYARMQQQQERERERVRVAQDLHDDLGAGLTEIGLLAGMLENNTALTPDRVREALARMVQRTRSLVTALDEIVWAVNPRNDSAQSLGGYFCRYAQEFFEATPITCRLEFREGKENAPLTSDQRHHLFLAFKEALANVARHSGASEVSVSISMVGGWLTILVRDNGRGLKPGAAPDGDGLRNFQQRMEQLGGTCQVQNQPTGGVEVRFNVPLTLGEK